MLTEQLDWRRMARVPGTTVDERFKKLHSDLVYRVFTRGGEPLLLYLLFEHQRTPHVRMPLRMSAYIHRVWMDWEKSDAAKGSSAVPLIFPMVLYNGSRAWVAPTSMDELYGSDSLVEALGRFRLRLDFFLIDLSQIPDEELTGTALGALTLLVFKHVDSDTFWEKFRLWAHLMEEVLRVPGGLRALEAVFRYGWLAAGRPEPEVEARVWAALPSELEELAVTWAESTREEGRREGRREGRLDELRQVVLDVVGRDGEVPVDVRARIEAATVDELRDWLRDALSAATITKLPGDIEG